MIWLHIRALTGVEVCIQYRDLFTMVVDVDIDVDFEGYFHSTLFDWDAYMDEWSESQNLRTRLEWWRKELLLR